MSGQDLGVAILSNVIAITIIYFYYGAFKINDTKLTHTITPKELESAL